MAARRRRSWLIVPAHDEARVVEATGSGADVLADPRQVEKAVCFAYTFPAKPWQK